jgi:hypothetical protein
MKLTLVDQLTQFMRVMQGALFPALPEESGPMTEKHRQLVALLNMLRIEVLIGCWHGGVGRPAKDRRAIARAFVALRHSREMTRVCSPGLTQAARLRRG